jgi:8-oxo-dGTP pyrophosphatase MutT (NUDIX family)
MPAQLDRAGKTCYDEAGGEMAVDSADEERRAMIDAATAVAAYRATLAGPLRQATLCFLVRDDEVLLAMKKRGFGAGKWNGAGGKPLRGEPIEAAALRETREEIGVAVCRLEHVAALNFYFPHLPVERDWNQQVYVYLVRSWEGEPGESEEMAPRWFEVDRLPLDDMWADDRYWLPRVLRGERLTAEFLYDATNEGVEAYTVTEKCGVSQARALGY